jgi:hypothetical protein
VSKVHVENIWREMNGFVYNVLSGGWYILMMYGRVNWELVVVYRVEFGWMGICKSLGMVGMVDQCCVLLYI